MARPKPVTPYFGDHDTEQHIEELAQLMTLIVHDGNQHWGRPVLEKEIDQGVDTIRHLALLHGVYELWLRGEMHILPDMSKGPDEWMAYLPTHRASPVST